MVGFQGQVNNACPAFADGCPYASNDEMVQLMKDRIVDDLGKCPSFKKGCPFREVPDMPNLLTALQKLPSSHVGDAVAENSEDQQVAQKVLVEMLQALHKASQNVKEQVGADCPVFQNDCPFKETRLTLELETDSQNLSEMANTTVSEVPATSEEPVLSAGPPQNLSEPGDDAETGDGLAKKLKEGTKEAHSKAETVHFVREFIKGKVTRDIYKQMVVNLYYVYEALEEALEKCWENPLVEPLHFPEELQRVEALGEDAEFYWGHDWKEVAKPSPVTVEYVARLREIAETRPELLTPHAYTRYLGDLSGGQVLKRAAVRGLKLPKGDDSGVRFYIFKRIRDVKGFKNMYRARLDALPADNATADAMVEEANYAFSLNTRMFEELDELAGFTDLPVPAMPEQDPASKSAVAACPFAAFAVAGAALPEGHRPVHGYSIATSTPKAAVDVSGRSVKGWHLAVIVAIVALLFAILFRKELM
eukprot:gnl/TRDRNA2_/TRDRNA2_28695_c0_seq1.p1 gnl/TRDRNA2_/TRDRNA2_28695_c0~~gnl/TRDRNA2_/TRDRNA2_28695_c0_seq1.p1  ORF type:complete len:501 (+),score=107.33 gnl/TRDRNA2_/TRDRNA2_28695_c0_seq1:73-1503(+)